MVDCYTQAKNSFLKSKFPDFPNILITSLSLSLTIKVKTKDTAKNISLLNAVLKDFSDKNCIVEKGKVLLSFDSEREIEEVFYALSCVISIAWIFKPYAFQVNDIEINERYQIRYVLEYYAEKHGIRFYGFSSPEEIKHKYITSKRRSHIKHDEVVNKAKISSKDPQGALLAVINKYVEIYGHNKEVQRFEVSQNEKVLVIENGAIIDFRIYPFPLSRKEDHYFTEREWEYPEIVIQELCHNDLYKFNSAGFHRHIESKGVSIQTCTFHGMDYHEAEIDRFNYVDMTLPQLQLKKRFEEYHGETHHLILLRIEDSAGEIHYGFAETRGKVHSFIQKLCNELQENKQIKYENAYMFSCLDVNINGEFLDAFVSWKGTRKRKRWILENKFSYFYEDRDFKNDNELFTIGYDIIDLAKNGKYDDCEFGSYITPLNRWKSEELVYKTVKKLYGDYEVIYQYKPFFLATDKGNMSYDIYICGLKIAIEYQGKQHFEPVDYFGGKENFDKQRERDRLKAELSMENEIKLIYVNYWEDITPDVIRAKIEAVRSK